MEASVLGDGPHHLESGWTLWYDKRQDKRQDKKPQGPTPEGNWDSNLKDVFTFSTVEDFWRYYNHIQKPCVVAMNANYHLFKENIKPMWEDPANKDGGKWILNLNQLKGADRALLDRYWENLVRAFAVHCLWYD
eukprot:c19899_g1_i2.p2 GENE.c19899_g1_i2~~c19899_g1_i2.p2  ORF type:complete len:134 (-),score=22.69 c19899_g1_i2:976-1377(-)